MLKQIDLVQKENDGRAREPPRVANAVEQGQGLLHTVLEEVVSEVSIVA